MKKRFNPISLLSTAKIICLVSGFVLGALTTGWVGKFAGVKPTGSSSIVYVEASPSLRLSTLILNSRGGSSFAYTCQSLGDFSTATGTSLDAWKCANGMTLVLDAQYNLDCENVWKMYNRTNSPFISSTPSRSSGSSKESK